MKMQRIETLRSLVIIKLRLNLFNRRIIKKNILKLTDEEKKDIVYENLLHDYVKSVFQGFGNYLGTKGILE